MRWIIWLLLIFIAAIIVASTTSTLTETASVSFFMYENRYDIGFNAFVIFAGLAVAAFYCAMRLLMGIIKAPSRTRRWNALRKERYSHTKLNQATLQYFAGRYARSLKNVKKSLSFYENNGIPTDKANGSIEFCVLAHLLAATNENRLGNKESSIAELQKAIAQAKSSSLSEAPDGLELLSIEWFIQNNQPEAAREALKKLDPGVARRISALQMQLQVDRMENKPHSALRTVKLLAKHHAYEPEQAKSVIIESACKVLEVTNDAKELQEAWNGLDKKDRKLPEIVAYAAKHYAILGDAVSARALIESVWKDLPAMAPQAQKELLLTLDMVLADADDTWLKRLEKACDENTDDAMLTYLAGRICHQHGVTGRAHALLEKSARNPKLPSLLRQRAWFTIAQLAEKNGELAQANACYKEAVQLLP